MLYEVFRFLAAQPQKLLNLQNSSEDRECMQYSFSNFNTFLPVDGTSPNFPLDFIFYLQVAACRFPNRYVQIRDVHNQ
jgi:hypothetical protein